jgi:hypothetical protein
MSSLHDLNCSDGSPPDDTVHVLSVAHLVERVKSYQLPLEMRRSLESFNRWRPLQEELLSIIALTREEDWPFQYFPPGWASRAGATLRGVEEELWKEMDCHYPQASASNLRRLMGSLQKAVEDAASLSGREVGLCRAILQQTESRYGRVGSLERTQALEDRARILRNDPLEVQRADLLRELSVLDQDSGISDLDEFLRPLVLAPPLLKLVRKARQARPSELIESGLINSLDDLSSVIPQLVDGAGLVGLLGRVVQLWWCHFPWQPLSGSFRDGLHQILELQGESWRFPDKPEQVESGYLDSTLQALEGSLFLRYFGSPSEIVVSSDLGDPKERQQAWTNFENRSAWGSFALVRHGLIPLQPRKSANACLDFCRSCLGREVSRPYPRLKRHKLVAAAWSQMVFFLSFCSASDRLMLLQNDSQDALKPYLEDLLLCDEGRSYRRTLRVWVDDDEAVIG